MPATRPARATRGRGHTLRRIAASHVVRGRALQRSPTVYPSSMRWTLVLATALLLGIPAGGAAQTSPLFQFGRTGGTIEPFTVAINTDGTLSVSGDVRLAKPNTRLSHTRLATLLRYARTQHFWSLPGRTACRGSLPDFAGFFVTIHTASKSRTVTVRGACRPRF